LFPLGTLGIDAASAGPWDRPTDPVLKQTKDPLAIGQITTRMSDKKETLDFYENILGMKLILEEKLSPYPSWPRSGLIILSRGM
jgi:hypothetical protein